MINLILASKSPIRKNMLEEENLQFEVMVSEADETVNLSKSFEEQLKEISMRKAQVIFKETIDRKERIIIAADQNIVFNNKMYGKPSNLSDARELIQSMEGKDSIYSYVGNTLIHANGDRIIKIINNCDISRMRMDNISDIELEEYLENNNPLTKCGGINITDTKFLHLEEGRISTAKGMTIEYLKDLICSLK